MDTRTSAKEAVYCDLCDMALIQMHYDNCLINLCTSIYQIKVLNTMRAGSSVLLIDRGKETSIIIGYLDEQEVR